MKTVTKIAGLVLGGLIWSLVPAWAAVPVPYSDTFSVPPYVNNTTIVGQNGWQNNGSGTASLAVITNDFSGSGRGTSLFIGNSSGAWADTKQLFTGINNGLWEVKFDLFGSMPSSVFATPDVELFGSDGKEVAIVEGVRNGVNQFRLNVNNSLLVPGITVQGSTWYTGSFVFDLAALKYNFWITDGVSTGALNNVPFWVSTAGDIGYIRLLPAQPGSFPNNSGLIDNLSVSVYAPEPSTAMLLFLGAAMMVYFRKNR